MTTTKDLIAYLDHGLTLDDLKGLCPEHQRKLTSLLHHWADLSEGGIPPAKPEPFNSDYVDALTLAREVMDWMDTLFTQVQTKVITLEKAHYREMGAPPSTRTDFAPSELSCLIGIGCDIASRWATTFNDMVREHEAQK